jgi:hypothetical protein
MGKKLGPGSGMNNPDHISESGRGSGGKDKLKFSIPDPGSGAFLTPGSRMGKK